MSEGELDFEALFRAGPAGAIVTDQDDLIVEVNDAFTTWTGHLRDDLIGTPFARLMPIADRVLFATRTRPMVDLNGRIPEIALTILDSEGATLPARLVASRVRAARDVTMFLLGPRRERSFEETQLISAVRRAEDSDLRRREAEQDLDHLTHHDPLTGLLNRDGLKRAQRSFAVPMERFEMLWVGLDHFRVINDSLGHPAGDEILRALANRISRHCSHAHTLLARVGGDEFAILTDGGQDEGYADRLLGIIAEPVSAEGLEIVVSASIGVARASSGPVSRSSPIDTLLRNAQTGMYEAKASGRNRWKRYTPVDDDSAVNGIRLVGEIRQAMARDEFRLEYQPQLDLRTGSLHGFEALIRWDHPERGVLGPADFIDIAERTGLIVPLGTWACRTAIDEIATLADDAVVSASRVSVNVSARQLVDRQLPAIIETMFAATTFDPARLTVEITETALITDSAQALDNLHRLKGLGVRVSIDDFGTGHAGCSYLDDLPADEIKIDRSYVQRLPASPEATAIVVSCIELAHALSLTVVAEGVETADQLTQLTQLDCDVIQGFHYARPLPVDGLRRWIDR